MTHPTFDLAGRTAVITGGSSGIGLASAALLRKAGASVAIVGRDQGKLDRAEAEIGAGVKTVRADLSHAAGGQRLADALAGSRVHVLFANAGASNAPELWDTTEAQFDAVIDANLKSTFFTVTALQELLAPSASVVLCSSVGYHRGTIGDPLYNAAKAGARALGRGLAATFAERQIRVNTISFGAVRTPMTGSEQPELADVLDDWATEHIPLKRWAEPGEAAAAVLFLASDASSYITGAELAVDGGLAQV